MQDLCALNGSRLLLLDSEAHTNTTHHETAKEDSLLSLYGSKISPSSTYPGSDSSMNPPLTLEYVGYPFPRMENGDRMLFDFCEYNRHSGLP